jgi:hypothetical protein
VALTASFSEAVEVLAQRGLLFDKDTLRLISYRYAARVRAFQQNNAQAMENLAGCRIVISVDGGRIRLREKKEDKKGPKGGSCYCPEWREAKMLIIYTVNNEGRIDKSFRPIIDGMISGPDELFSLLTYYLSNLQLNHARQILFVADGARWIWTRLPLLMESLGCQPIQRYQLLDFYYFYCI